MKPMLKRFKLFLISALICLSTQFAYAEWPKIPEGDFTALRKLLRGSGEIEPAVLAYENELIRVRQVLKTLPEVNQAPQDPHELVFFLADLPASHPELSNPSQKIESLWHFDFFLVKSAYHSMIDWDEYVRDKVSGYLTRHTPTPELKQILDHSGPSSTPVTIPAAAETPDHSPEALAKKIQSFLSENSITNRRDPNQNVQEVFRQKSPSSDKSVGEQLFALWDQARTTTQKLEVIGYIEIFAYINHSGAYMNATRPDLIDIVLKHAFSNAGILDLLTRIEVYQHQVSISWPSPIYFQTRQEYYTNPSPGLDKYPKN